MSRTFSISYGSGDSLKVSLRCGCRRVCDINVEAQAAVERDSQ
jgi:hypothetical protein